MKILVVLALVLASCGGFSSSDAWPDHSVAPSFAVVPPPDVTFALDTPSDRFGVATLGQVEVFAIGYAVAAGKPVVFLTGGQVGIGDLFECEASENPPAGLLFVVAQDFYGQEFVALVEYDPGVNDGWYVSRNDAWFD